MVGLNVSTNVTENYLKSAIDASTKFLNTQGNIQSSGIDAVQEININIEGSSFDNSGCDKQTFVVRQGDTVKQNIIKAMTDEETLDLETNLETQVRLDVKNQTKQLNKNFNLFQANISTNSTKNTEILSKDVSKEVQKISSRIQEDQIDIRQVQNINIKDSTFRCVGLEFSNDIDVTQEVANGIESVVDIKATDVILEKLLYTLDNLTAQRNDGIDIEGIFNSFAMMWIIIVICIAVVFMGVLFLIPKIVSSPTKLMTSLIPRKKR